MLVTGAGGFVGSAVVRHLADRGAFFEDGTPVEHVVALLRPGSSAERLAELAPGDGWSIERANVADGAMLGATLQRSRPRAVVHAALPGDAYDVAAEELVRPPLETLVAALSEVEGGRLIHAGSAWVLAAGEHLDETSRSDPRTPYARNKALEDRLLPELATAAGISWVNLRLFNLFGRHEKPDRLLPTLVRGLSRAKPVKLSSGDQVRDFNDVDRVARAFALALAAPEALCGTVYHVGSGRGIAVRDFAAIVARQFGGAHLLRFGTSQTSDRHLPALVADPARAARALGWQPDLRVEDRVHEAVVWWLERLDAESETRRTA